MISTARLHAVLEHEPADLVIGVQAGTPVDAVHQALAAKQQWLPLDPPAARAATVGAVAALGSSGPLRAAHGTPRDMVLGVEIATGDGRLIRFGGRVVKNVAGYDGVRLSVASAGRLGIITALYLRVRGTPRSDRTLAIACGSGADGMGRGADTARALRDSIACDALELISPAVAARLSGRTQSDWLLLVRMLGSAAAADDGLARVKAIAGAASELPPDIWPALVRLEAEAGAFLRLMGSTTTLDQGLGLASMVPAKASQSDEWMTAAHAMDGIVRLWNPDATSALSRDLVGEAVREAARHDWTVRYESNEATHPSEQTRPGAEPAATTHAGDLIRRRLEDRLKAVFDPAGILPAGAGA